MLDNVSPHPISVRDSGHTSPKLHKYLLRCCWKSRQSKDLAEKWSEHHQQRVITMGNCFFSQNKNTNIRISLPAVCFVWEIAMVVLFGVFVRYDDESDAHWPEYKKAHNITSDSENDFYYRYPSKYNNACKERKKWIVRAIDSNSITNSLLVIDIIILPS